MKVKGVFRYDLRIGASFADDQVLPPPFKDMQRSVRAHFVSSFHAKQMEKRKLMKNVAAGEIRSRKTVSDNVLRTAYTVLKKSLPYATFEDLVVLQNSNGVKVGNINHSRMLVPSLRSEFCLLMRKRLMRFIQEQPCIALVADKVTIANRTVDITAILAVVGNAPPEHRFQSFVISAPVVAAHDGQSIAKELVSSLNSHRCGASGPAVCHLHGRTVPPDWGADSCHQKYGCCQWCSEVSCCGRLGRIPLAQSRGQRR